MIYLDHAAATPVDDEVMASMQPYWQERFYNPGSLYAAAREVKTTLQDARKTVAGLLSASPNETYFTAGATESINIAFNGVARMFSDTTVALSAIEHESVLSAAGFFADTEMIRTSNTGLITPEAARQAVTEKTVMVSVGLINSEIGTIQPLRDIAAALEELREERRRNKNTLPLYLHVDASAAPDYTDIRPRRIGANLLTLNGGKIYGPKQSGVLYASKDVKLVPYIRGGGQESGLRSGTENVAFAVGFAKSLEISDRLRKQETRRQGLLRDRLIKALLEIPDSVLNGPANNRAAGNVNVGFGAVNGETLVHYLDASGIMVATGAACSARNDEPSHVLQSIEVAEKYIDGSIRLSLGRTTTEKDIDRVAEVISETVFNLRRQR